MVQVDAATAGLILSAISTLVVIIGAVAGLRQLRHIRHGNELATLTALQAQFETPEMLEARTFVRSGLADALNDAGFMAELRGPHLGPRAQRLLLVANFFELLGIYVRYGALSAPMTLTMWGVVAAEQWKLMRPAILILREQHMVLGYFEDFAIRSERWFDGKKFSSIVNGLARDTAER